MSCYEWMEGTLTMRTSDVNKLQKLLLARESQEYERIVKTVNTAIEQVLVAFKGKRAVNWRKELVERLLVAVRREEDYFFDRIKVLLKDFKTLFPAGEDKRPVPLKLSALPKLDTKKVKFDLSFFGTLYLDKKSGRVTVCVSENNHAVDAATSTSNWGVLYKFCNELTWPRGGGGELVGNDEYNREGRESGGGSNYTRFSWRYQSPAAKAKQEDLRRRNRGFYSGYGRRI